jgi:hypothetical protein
VPDGVLNTEIRAVNPRRCRPQQVNARYMSKEEYDRLVANVRRDGCLTSVPLVAPIDGDPAYDHEIISGHHRLAAAVEVGLPKVDAMVILDDQSRQEIIARQLSHNAISGHDDPATLKQLYQELDEVDWRDYAALDDKQLELLEQVTLDSLSEGNLDFTTLTITFLPNEYDEADKVMEELRAMIKTDHAWIASISQYDQVLDTLATAHQAYDVTNVASALGIITLLVRRHVEDLREGWYSEQAETARHKGRAPMETVFGSTSMPAESAAVIQRALAKAIEKGEIEAHERWKFMELLAADWLAGA